MFATPSEVTPSARPGKRRCESDGPSAKVARTGGSSDAHDPETQLAALEAASANLKALGTKALNSGMATRLEHVERQLFSLRYPLQQQQRQRRQQMAARPIDDSFLGGTVQLPLELLEHVAFYLSPRDMASATRATRHLSQAVRGAVTVRVHALGLELDEADKATPQLLAKLERQLQAAPKLLEKLEYADYQKLCQFHCSVLRTLLDDQRLLEMINASDDQSAARRSLAFDIVIEAKPAPAWCARHAAAIVAGSQESGGIDSRNTNSCALSLMKRMSASEIEKHVDAILPFLLKETWYDREDALELLEKLPRQTLARFRAELEACLRDCVAKDFENPAQLARQLLGHAA